MRYVSVCSGIEAATAAWHPLGWRPLWFSEIEPFPSRVLAHHYPEVENRGGFTQAYREGETCDLLVGGTPCQSFSVAGERAGLDDPRGVLAVEFARLARHLRARWVVWENVPGVLSHDGGRTFGEILGALAECGYGFAYRVLDAQGFGVPQRRRRVFVVGHLGDWRPAASVLFEPESLRRDPAPRRATREDPSDTPEASVGVGVQGRADLAHTLMTHRRDNGSDETFVTAVHATQDPISGPVSPCLSKTGDVAICFDEQQVTSAQNRSRCAPGDPAPTLSEQSDRDAVALLGRRVVRRLTPRERERLQGFPDDYTAIPGAKDGPRNAALGNSMAVPVMRWIGERLALADRIVAALRAAGA